MFDAGNGVGGSVSLFESREAAEAGNEKAVAWVKDNLADLYDGRPSEVTKGEIVASIVG